MLLEGSPSNIFCVWAYGNYIYDLGPTPDLKVYPNRTEVSPAGRISPPRIAGGRQILSQDTAKPEPQTIQTYPTHISSLLPTIVSCPTKFVTHSKRSWPWHNLLPEFPSKTGHSGAIIKSEPSGSSNDPNNERNYDNSDGLKNGKRNGNYYQSSKHGGSTGHYSPFCSNGGTEKNGTAPTMQTETYQEYVVIGYTFLTHFLSKI